MTHATVRLKIGIRWWFWPALALGRLALRITRGKHPTAYMIDRIAKNAVYVKPLEGL